MWLSPASQRFSCLRNQELRGRCRASATGADNALSAVLDNCRGQEDQNLLAVDTAVVGTEQVADDRQVAQDRNIVPRPVLLLGDKATQHHRLPIRDTPIG